MIRIVSIAALLCLLVLVLYLPSAHPPERFLAQIRSEHQAIEEIWGETPALRILDRARDGRDGRLVKHHGAAGHRSLHRVGIDDRALDELDLALHRLEVLTPAGREVVEDSHGFARREERLGDGRPDEPCAARDKNRCHGR